MWPFNENSKNLINDDSENLNTESIEKPVPGSMIEMLKKSSMTNEDQINCLVTEFNISSEKAETLLNG